MLLCSSEGLGLEQARGALVTDVPEGPAMEAGIEAGDVILSFDGAEVADTGDLVRMDTDESAARAPGRRLLSIDGREEDYVELQTGARVGRLDHIFKALTFVHEAQIRQREAGSIAIHVVPRGAWTHAHEQRCLFVCVMYVVWI